MTNDLQPTNAELRAQVYALQQRLAVLERADAERLRAEEALRASQAHLRLLIEQMPAILWATDADLRITTSVGAGLAGLGLAPNQVVGMLLPEFLGTTDPDHLPLAIHHRALRGESGTITLPFRGRTFHAHLEPLTGADGRVSGIVGVALDITERQQTEEALRESQRSLSTLDRK